MRRLWKWLLGSIVLVAFTASLTAFFRGTFDAALRELLPSGDEISCIGREWIIDGREWITDHLPFRQPEPAKEVFRILVAALDHDDANRTLTEAVVRAFQGEKGLEAIETCRVLKIDGAGERIEDAAAKRGQEWLSGRDADVLVFGEVVGKGEALNLHFLSVGGSGDFHQHAFELKAGLLKGDFSEAVGAQLQAVALATVKPATELSRKYVVEMLRPVAGRLEQLIRFPPSGLSARQLTDIQFALGLALSIIGEQAGDNKALEEAVTAFREALKEWTRERAPLDWALTQANLAGALEALGERESGTEEFEESIAASREALKEGTRERVPLQWALTQNNLGNALRALGERESGTGKLDEAVAAYREALKEWTRERVPLDWAGTQNNLGNALVRLGERESGTGKFEEAVAVFREVLKEWTRERAPPLWAMAQANLGTALVRLGERESGTGKFEEAVAAFREALKEYTREHAPSYNEITTQNLNMVLNLLEQRRRK